MAFQLCRICGSKKDLLNILDQGPTMLEKLSKCASVEISFDDFLPKQICRPCDRMLDISYQLRKQSESTRQKLQHELQKQNEAEVHYISDDEEPKSEIVVPKSEIELKQEQVTSSNIPLIPEQENSRISAISAAEEFSLIELDAKTESTALASETEDVDDLNQLISTQNPSVQPFSSTSVDDIESNESYDLPISRGRAVPNTINEIITEDNDHIAIDRMNDELTHASQNTTTDSAYRTAIDFCSTDILSDGDQEDCMTDSRSSLSPYTCSTCSQTFTRKRKFEQHMRQHNGGRFQCRICLVYFPTRYRLSRHETTHPETKRSRTSHYDCPYCKRNYTAAYNLERHMNACHTKENSFVCDICHVAFARQDVLRRHVQQIHVNKKWHCKNCGESFRSAHYLNQHKTIANCYYEPPNTLYVKQNGALSHPLPDEYIVKVSNDRYKCVYCSVLFKTLTTYRNHLLIHQNVRPFPCTTCPKAFRTRYALINHERIHNNERPFNCDLCSKSFRQVTHLKHHRYQHTKDEMPFHCTKCKMRFVTKWKLRDHLRKFCAEKAFKCAECPEEFYLKYDLKRHARSVHYRSVDIVESDNEGNQKKQMDFTEGTTETDRTDEEQDMGNDFNEEVIDILDDDDEKEIYGESSNSMQEKVLVLNEADPEFMDDHTAISAKNNLNKATNQVNSNTSFQTPLPPNLHSEDANEPQFQYINFDQDEVAAVTTPNNEVVTKTKSEEIILDYIDLEEDNAVPMEQLLNEPLNNEIPTEVPNAEIDTDVINLDDDENEIKLNSSCPQTSNIAFGNEPILNCADYMLDSKPRVLSSMLLKSADSVAESKENIIDFIHLDSSNSCKSPPRHFNSEYYENKFEKVEQQDEYDTIVEEKIQITGEQVENFTIFYND